VAAGTVNSLYVVSNKNHRNTAFRLQKE